MGKPSAPPPPDYVGAAKAQGLASKEAALASGQLANPNVDNPYGTQRVSYQNDPTTGNPVPYISQSFAPGQQKIFENNQALQQKLGMLGISAADLAGGTINEKLDFNGRLGGIPQGRQEVIDAMMRRYDTDAARQKEGINSDLIARGIPQGSKAYEVEMDRLSRGRNDALQQATIAADDRAMQERRQRITELLAERQVPLNEISAFRTGSQISPLQFANAQGQTVGAAPIFSATNAQGQYGTDVYNADMAQQGQNTQLIGSLAAAAAMYF